MQKLSICAGQGQEQGVGGKGLGSRGGLKLFKNSPIKGSGGLSKMSKKMSIIELSRIGQDLFDFSDLT